MRREWARPPYGAAVEDTAVVIWEDGPFGGAGSDATHARFLRGAAWDFVERYLGHEALLEMLVEVIARSRRTSAVAAVVPVRWLSEPPEQMRRHREELLADLREGGDPAEMKNYAHATLATIAVLPPPASSPSGKKNRREAQAASDLWTAPLEAPRACSTCTALGDEIRADGYDTVLPREADLLLAFVRDDFPASPRTFVLGCARCGTFYEYDDDPGDNSPTSGFGESLVRLSPKRALTLLSKRYAAARKWLEEQGD